MDASSLVHFFSQYGLLVLFLWLVVGIFILPVPEEVVMLTVGILISRGVFSFWGYFVASAGSLCGVTFSYFLGCFLGRFLIVKYGKWIGVSEKRLHQGETLFEQYGKWSLPFGYYIPGTRHLMSIVAGTTHFGWKRFALFAYPAGVLWVVLLITLGYLAGDFWVRIYHLGIRYFYYFVVLFCVLALGFLIYWYKFRKKSKT